MSDEIKLRRTPIMSWPTEHYPYFARVFQSNKPGFGILVTPTGNNEQRIEWVRFRDGHYRNWYVVEHLPKHEHLTETQVEELLEANVQVVPGEQGSQQVAR